MTRRIKKKIMNHEGKNLPTKIKRYLKSSPSPKHVKLLERGRKNIYNLENHPVRFYKRVNRDLKKLIKEFPDANKTIIELATVYIENRRKYSDRYGS